MNPMNLSGIVRDRVVSTMAGSKVDASGKSTMPYGTARVLYPGGAVSNERPLGVLESRVIPGVGVISHGVDGVISSSAVVGDGSAKLRQSHQSAAERRDRLNVRLVRAGQPPLPRLSRWSP